jgi:hypothetical protein
MKQKSSGKGTTDHWPLVPTGVQERADRAFDAWFKDLRLDDKDGALFAKVPKKILQKVFTTGFQNGGHVHWSKLTEPQVKALVRFYAPEATVRTPKDVSSSCAILERLEGEVRRKTTDDAMQGLKLARFIGEARALLQGFEEAGAQQATEEREPSAPRWGMVEEHGPGWEDHREGTTDRGQGDV